MFSLETFNTGVKGSSVVQLLVNLVGALNTHISGNIVTVDDVLVGGEAIK